MVIVKLTCLHGTGLFPTDVAEIVLNKCMEVTDRDKQSVHGPAVTFNYDYVDDFAEPEKHSNSADGTGIHNTSK